MKSTISTALGRALIGTGVAVALASASLIGAGAATAASDPELEKVVAANSGTVIVRLPDDYANATVFVAAPLPGSDEPRVTSAAVQPEADTDGYFAELDNFAGPVYIGVVNGSEAGSKVAAEAVEVAPGYDANAAIYRHAAIEYTLDEATGEFTPGDVPSSPAPDSEELDWLIPYADYTFTPDSYEKGKSFTLKFRDIVSGIDGTRVGEQEPHPVDFYGYSAATFLSSTSIVGGAVDFTVPVAYTDAPHEIAAFDEFGRINLWVTLDGGIAAPVNNPVQRPAATLANTGAADNSAAVALGLGALVAGAAAVVGGVALRSRRSVKA
ncbi:LPXTG cell wall anchor domain-containing protein [Herbiconiux liangxiaofengii]|uniref:LPXTG cell wall anchor domain-containing protein n=1 Tax=Herbiconiux liangxiaofengii TaxID=3342795 RepID=UPI0035BAD578